MVNPINIILFKVCGKKNYQREYHIKFLCQEPVEGEDGREDLPDKDILDIELGTWKIYFDGAVNQYGNGIGTLLITLEGSHKLLAVKLNFEATNNIVEYEACIAEMEAL